MLLIPKGESFVAGRSWLLGYQDGEVKDVNLVAIVCVCCATVSYFAYRLGFNLAIMPVCQTRLKESLH